MTPDSTKLRQLGDGVRRRSWPSVRWTSRVEISPQLERIVAAARPARSPAVASVDLFPPAKPPAPPLAQGPGLPKGDFGSSVAAAQAANARGGELSRAALHLAQGLIGIGQRRLHIQARGLLGAACRVKKASAQRCFTATSKTKQDREGQYPHQASAIL